MVLIQHFVIFSGTWIENQSTLWVHTNSRARTIDKVLSYHCSACPGQRVGNYFCFVAQKKSEIFIKARVFAYSRDVRPVTLVEHLRATTILVTWPFGALRSAGIAKLTWDKTSFEDGMRGECAPLELNFVCFPSNQCQRLHLFEYSNIKFAQRPRTDALQRRFEQPEMFHWPIRSSVPVSADREFRM